MKLNLKEVLKIAKEFCISESTHDEPTLYGVTDGKKIGTYIEHKFLEKLEKEHGFRNEGSSASGIDIPELNIDIKTTKISQPQSSCPFRSAEEKVFGLGYHLLVFVYDKNDDQTTKTARLKIKHAIFIDKERTGDYITTKGLIDILKLDANEEDIIAFLLDRNLPVDDIQAQQLAKKILTNPPKIGYLTISNALQWRLQYKRAIEIAQKGNSEGVIDIFQENM